MQKLFIKNKAIFSEFNNLKIIIILKTNMFVTLNKTYIKIIYNRFKMKLKLQKNFFSTSLN